MRHPTKDNDAGEPEELEEPEEPEDEGAEEAEDVSNIMDESSKGSCTFTSLLCTVPASGQGSSFMGGAEKVAADFRMKNGVHGRVRQ